MRFSLLLVVSFITLSRTNIIRKERDTCDQVLADFDACTLQAYNDYKVAFEAGDDGRPDWMARKSCNYMTAAVEDCGNKLIGECNTEEEVNENKDHQLKGILIQLQSSVEEWDSEKCPAIKDHINRVKGEEIVEEGVEAGARKVEEDTQEQDPDQTVEKTDEGTGDAPEVVADPDADGDGDADDNDESSASSMLVSLPLMMTLYMTI